MLTAVQCSFKRKHHPQKSQGWERGIAIATSHGSNDVVCIIPKDATSPIDVLKDVYDYYLCWTDGILKLE